MPDSLPTPVTRREAYLAKAAGMSVSLPAYPVTREERYLAAIAEGGGGGGSGATIVNFSKSGNNIVCDTSIADILTAAASGPVFGVVNATVFSAHNVVGTLILMLQETNATSPTEVTFLGDYHRTSDGTYPETTGIASLYGYTMLGADIWTAKYNPVEPLVVTYTITGQAVDGQYPLSADYTFNEVYAAVTGGRTVNGVVSLDGNTAISSLNSYSASGMAFSTIAYIDGVPCLLNITHTLTQMFAQIAPISTVQMTYNTSTGALSMSNVPEVNS